MQQEGTVFEHCGTCTGSGCPASEVTGGTCFANPGGYCQDLGGCVECQNCDCIPVNGGWTGWSSCYANWQGCIKDRACTNPAPSCGGAACAGDNWTSCTAAEVGCNDQSCPTNADYCGGTVNDGTLASGCTCGTKSCPAIGDGAPGTPGMVSPIGTLANPVVVSPGTTATLVWNSVPALTDYYEIQVLDAGNSVAWTGTTTSTSIRTAPLIMGSAYSWRVRAVNTTCGTDIGNWSSRGYFRLNSIPSVNIVVLKNSSGTAVSWDAGNRNHIAKSGFYSNPLPRRVRFEARVTDDDGADQIQTVQMRWNGNVYNLSLGTSAGVGLTASVTVDFSSGNNSASTYPLAFLAEDIYSSSGWVDSIYSWKVWDCLVPVSGKLYDGSAGQACNNTGFTVTAGNNLNFNSLIFTNMSGGNDVTVNVSTPASFSGGDLVWSQSYLPIFNGGNVGDPDGDLAGSGRFTRWIDLGVGTTYCPGSSQFSVSSKVSAYSTNESSQTDFSFIRDQENWFQVWGGGVKARSGIRSGVPVTAASTLTINNTGIGVSNNGVVASTTYYNTNGYNDASQYGNPNNWRIVDNIVADEGYNYQYLYSRYFINLGQGVTNTSIAGAGSTGVVFVGGNLTISSDVIVPVGKFLMVIASGSITVGAGVNQVDGIYVADGGINIGGNSGTQMVVNGVLYSTKGNNVRLNRSYTIKEDNNTSPAVAVKFRPDFIFNMPGKLTKLLSDWKEF